MATTGYYSSICVQCGTLFRHDYKTQTVCSRFCSRRRYLGSAADRFWTNVEKTDGCWSWIGYRDRKGYGQIRLDGIDWKAHRFSYTLNVGPIPTGMEVCHHCDHPWCVRPDHLFVGTHLENIRDSIVKGRRTSYVGTLNNKAKLTEEQVLDIRARFAAAGNRWARGQLKVICAEYGISDTHIYWITHGRNWKHL